MNEDLVELNFVDYKIPHTLLCDSGYIATAIINNKHYSISIINDLKFRSSEEKDNKKYIEIWLEDNKHWHTYLIDSRDNIYDAYTTDLIGKIVFMVKKEALINCINEI